MIKTVLMAVFSAFTLIPMYAVLAAQPSAYSGQEQREIKALSPDDIQAYLTGKGAGFAKAAELNRYPGPSHVLELSDKLQLSAEQKRRTQAIFDAMQQEAIRQGKVLVERERELDRKFSAGEITADSLDAALKKIGESYAGVRGAHLKAHIEQRAILTPSQVARYDELRGYTTGGKLSPRDSGSHAH